MSSRTASASPASLVAHDPPVGQDDQPVGVGGGAGLVGDHHDRLAELVRRSAQEREHLGGGGRVEVAGRLVGEHHRRLVDERPGDGDALLLAAGELRRAVREAVADADGRDELLEPLEVRIEPGERERQQDVLLGVQDRHEVVALEDEAELVAPQAGQRAVVEAGELRAVDRDRSRTSGDPGRRADASASTCPSPRAP